MQDGILDISVIRPFPFFVMLRMAIRLFTKNIDNSKYVSSYKGKEILLKRKKKGPFHFDGEPLEMGKKITFKVMPLGLKVIVAKQSKLIKI
jgi:diacylglycerol kinase family enzyme